MWKQMHNTTLEPQLDLEPFPTVEKHFIGVDT